MKRSDKAWIGALLLALLPIGCKEAPEESIDPPDAEDPAAKRSPEAPSLLPVRGPIDPGLVEALEEAAAPEEKEKPSAYQKAAATKLKGQEPDMAMQILDLPESDVREFALTELMRQWAGYDLEGAMAFGDAKLMEDRQTRRAFLKGAAPVLVQSNPERVLELIEEGNWWPDQWIPQREALRRIEREDFERASTFFANTSPNKQHPEEAYRYALRIAEEAEDPQAGLAYAQELEKPMARAYATRAAVSLWAETDTEGASAFVNEQTDPVIRDQAITGLIDEIWSTNPEESLIWAQEIGDTEFRQQVYTNLAGRWSDSPEDVDRLLAAPKLTPADRQAIEEQLAVLRGGPPE